MDRKVLHTDLHLGEKGEGRSLRIYGNGGNDLDSYVQIGISAREFSPISLLLPESYAANSVLTVDGNGQLYFDPAVLRAPGVDVVGRLDVDLPAGFAITGIVVENLDNATAQITFSSTAVGNDICQSFVADRMSVSTRPVLFAKSLEYDTPIYVNVLSDDDTFNGSTLDIYFMIKRFV